MGIPMFGEQEPETERFVVVDILRRTPSSSLRYSEAAVKVLVGAEPTIKDVCEHCNSVVLGRLDGYGAKLFDEQMVNSPTPGVPVTFTYDFTDLTLWLLKISFNSARASKHDDAEVLKRFVPDIVGSNTPDVVVALELIESAMGEKTSEGGIAVVREIKTETLRISRVKLGSGFVSTLHIVRLVAIHAYWFYLLIPTSESHNKDKLQTEQDTILSNWPGITVLSRDAGSVTLSTLGNNVVQMYESHILDKQSLYQETVDRLDRNGGET